MRNIESIYKSDLEQVLQGFSGSRAFVRHLQQIATEDELLRALGRYVYFNSPFGSGVANLAGEIAARQDLFRDPDEEMEIIADRSIEVAADIFFAAIDEFYNINTAKRNTHRSLAQATLKAAGLFFGHDFITLNSIMRMNESTLEAIRKVRYGYGVNQSLDERRIFRAIGFHIGSELLADEEFRILDNSIRSKYPDLVSHLKKTEVMINGSRQPAYLWIRLHTYVEADHFSAAVDCANHAISFYAGPESQACLKTWLLEGLMEFAEVQTEFMEHLMEE